MCIQGFLLMKKKVKTLSEMDNNSEFNVHTGVVQSNWNTILFGTPKYTSQFQFFVIH